MFSAPGQAVVEYCNRCKENITVTQTQLFFLIKWVNIQLNFMKYYEIYKNTFYFANLTLKLKPLTEHQPQR